MRRSLWVILMTSMLILTAAIQGNVRAQTPERFFPEGYSVRGAFLDYYERAPDALLLFGYPISNEVTAADGTVYQYFNRARMDLVQTEDGPRVQLFPLGTHLYNPEAVDPKNYNSPACRAFDNGYRVCHALLTFYDTYQGSLYLGKPISHFSLEDGRYVQYFENARLEYNGDPTAAQVVTLSDLGDYYLRNHDRAAMKPPERGGVYGALNPIQLQAHAFVTQPLIPAGEQQTIYVIAIDQSTYTPVEDAQVMLSVYYPNGRQDDIRLSPTGKDGITHHTFRVDDVAVKAVVRIEVEVTSGTSRAETSSWFRGWW